MHESDIEALAIAELAKLGYAHVQGRALSPDADAPLRDSYQDAVLRQPLQDALARLNPQASPDMLADALRQVLRPPVGDLLTANAHIHKLLTEGADVLYTHAGETRGDKLRLLDFDQPHNNTLWVVSQLELQEEGHTKIPDLILYVNGLPLVVIELKNATRESATLRMAYQQVQTYKVQLPTLFAYNALLVLSDGLEAKSGTVSAGFSRFLRWKTADGQQLASHLDSELITLIHGQLNPHTLLDLIRHFTVFESSKREDADGLTQVEVVKKMAAYHQYYAVNKAVESSLRAAQEGGDRKGGVIWHTQGSGKSLSMVFYTGKIIQQLHNPTVVVITDRNDLDDQLFDTFAASKDLLRQTPVQAEDRAHLKTLLRVASGGVVFTTVQKFQPDEGNIFETLTERKNVIVLADEAHRTQYGFKAKTVDDKDEAGNVIGQKTVYGFAKYLRDALPHATYLGFTGTPIESTDVNTPAVFGAYVDIYDIAQAVEDGATVRIFYESRLAKVNLSEEGKQLVEQLEAELEEEDISESQKAKAKWTQLEALIGSENRIKQVAADIVAHFEQRQDVFEGKGMIVGMSRRIVAQLYHEIVQLRPDWHHKDLNKGKLKVVMTAASSDGPQIAQHHTTKEQRRLLADRMKDPADALQLVIVRDMWLTGFDAPSMHTLYIDKPMKGHNLMQAIARVNRVYKDKPGGLVVDYIGIASDLKQALKFYAESGGKGDPTHLQEQAVELMLEKLEVVSNMFAEQPTTPYSSSFNQLVEDPAVPYLHKHKGLLYEEYFTADTATKLKIILAAQEHILSIEDGKARFNREVGALSQAFALAIPHPEALDIKEEVSFFQAVKARLSKFGTEGGDTTGNGAPKRSNEELETTIRQVIDKALVSEQVVDVFDAAGIKRPDISILSEEFLLELKGMAHKNTALETLRRLLNDEIKSRSKTNLVQSKTLMDMLESSIKRYHNKVLTAAEVIDELIKLANEIKDADKRGEALGLTDYELAFYDAVANNESARELMGQDTLRELAVLLYQTVKEKATIDWTKQESVRANLKISVKRALRKYGYPPDLQKLATDTVLKQAEMLADVLVEV